MKQDQNLEKSECANHGAADPKTEGASQLCRGSEHRAAQNGKVVPVAFSNCFKSLSLRSKRANFLSNWIF